MAAKPMKLRCKIALENDHTFTAHARMFDGTPFKLIVAEYDFKLNEDFLPSKRTVDGWLYVQQESQQHDRVYVTLPKATIEHGHHLVVSQLDLMPRQASIDDFKPKSVESLASVMNVSPQPQKTGLTKSKQPAEQEESVQSEESIEMAVETKSDMDEDLDI